MSGGGGGNNYQYIPMATSNNSETKSTIPSWLSAASQRGVSAATNLLNNPGQAYSGQLTAGLNNDQLAAGDIVRNSVGAYQPYYDSATGLTNYASTSAAPNVHAATFANGLSNIDRYMNPYISNVVDSVNALGQKNLKNALTQTADQAIGAKAFGGSRHGVQEGVATADNNLNTNKLLADLLAGGYTQAANFLGTDITNNLQAQTTNQANANTALDRMLSGANQLSNIGTANQAANNTDLNNLMNFGLLQQTTDQTGLTNNYNEFLRQQELPYKALQAYNQTLGTAPHDTTQNTSTSGFQYSPVQSTSSSPLSSALGYGLTGLSMFGGQYSPVGGLLNMFRPTTKAA